MKPITITITTTIDEETGWARAAEDNDILGLIDTLCKDKEEQK